MYVVVEHEIEDPESFWKTAETGMENLPSGLKLHQVFPNGEGTKAACLWEAGSVGRVRSFLEQEVGPYSDNEYYAVEAENAVGLPSVAQQ
jgi:hypothetical protein